MIIAYVFVFLAAFAASPVKCARLLPTVAQRLTNLHAAQHDVKLCTAFGFKSKSGLCIYDSLFRSDAIPKDIVVFNAETDNEILKLSAKGDVSVTHVSVLEKNSGAGLLLQNMGAYVRGLCNAGTPTTFLMVLVDGKESESVFLEKQINQITDEAHSFSCNVQVIFRYSGCNGGFDPEQVESVRDTLISKAIEAATKRKKVLSSSQVLSHIAHAVETPVAGSESDYFSTQPKKQNRNEEIAAVMACKDLPQVYQARLNGSIVDLLNNGLLHGGNTVNDTMEALELTVQGATETFQGDYHSLLSTHQASQMVSVTLPEQCHAVAAEVLLPVYRRIVQSMFHATIEDFTRRVRKVSPKTPDLTQVLYEMAHRASRSFAASLRRIHDGFAGMVESTSGVVIINSATSLTGAVAAHRAKKSAKLPQFDASFEQYQLASFVNDDVAERVRELGLAGVLNPYTRTSPFPPLHVNVNFQVHPKDISFAREFGRMYDEAKMGPCEDRADPLLFNGIAQVPFDPGFHPLTPDRRTLLQKLKFIVTGKED